MTPDYRIPTPEEIERIERSAHTLRAQVLAEGVRALGRAFRDLPSMLRRAAHI